jgi:hyperosmotically inducible periplasmic protein
MKTNHLSSLAIALVLPVALFASAETDRRIEEAAKGSYNFRVVLANQVKVKTADGVATLSGSVSDKDDRALAADTVENLPGVVAVKNEITVLETYPEHSDAWIAFKVRGRLLVKANVSAMSTKVEVKDGIVTLSGTAENLAQKELTGLYAGEIARVKSVNNAITIDPKAYAASKVAQTVDDASITSQVKFALLGHKSTSALKTKVTTNDSTVVISGEASSDALKSLVTKLATDVVGVKSVTNNMVVKT